jgi:hypothetical protein
VILRSPNNDRELGIGKDETSDSDDDPFIGNYDLGYLI